MQYRITYLRPPLSDGMWLEIARCLAPAVAVAGGRYVPQDVLERIAGGFYHLLAVHDEEGELVAALTAATIAYPQLRSLEVSFLGGTHGLEWGPNMLKSVESLALLTGCSRVEFRGRKEWGRVLEKDGYQVACTLYEKRIEPCGSLVEGTTSAH